MYNIKNRNFLTLMDFTPKEIEFLLNLSQNLKKSKYTGTEQPKLKGKNIALLFEKDSTRTRCAFQIAAQDQGAHVIYLGPTGNQIGKKESMADTARVLGRMCDGIEYRGFSQKTIEILAKYSKIPVWNGLTDEDHPTQVLADFLTLKECFNKPLKEITLVYIGDGRNNMANALMIGATKMGMNFKIITPKELFPNKELIKKCKTICENTKGIINITDNIDEVKNADVLYTDVWVSMGEPEKVWDYRINLLTPYQVNMNLIEKTKNPNVKFMHCLPAFHNTNTELGKKIYEKYKLTSLEVTNEVFESKYSIVFDEAENRMHTIKAIMVATLGNL